MGEVLAWPVVRREDIVRAAAPGESVGRESPFRALRARGLASAGVAVPRRHAGRLAGQSVLYSSLNVIAARFARVGDTDSAARAAQAAALVEAGAGFDRLKGLLRPLSEDQRQAVLDGQVSVGEQGAELRLVLGSLAQEIAQIAAGLPPSGEEFAGEVSERRGDSVVVSAADGTRTAVPLWLARAAHRDQVGDRLILVSVRLDEYQALVHVVPGIAVPVQRSFGEPSAPFSPFGRGDRRVTEVSGQDVARMRGKAQPLRVLVPVTIEA